MYNPVLLEMLAREQSRRIQEEINQRAVLRDVKQEQIDLFAWLRSWVHPISIKQASQPKPCSETPIIRQHPRGQTTF